MIAMSAVSGSFGVDRCESRECGCVRQKGSVDVGHGNVDAAGNGVWALYTDMIARGRTVGSILRRRRADRANVEVRF